MAANNSTKLLSRFEDDLPPIQVTCQGELQLTLGDVETTLQDVLDESTRPICHLHRADQGYLGCRKPAFPLESFLGFYEELSSSQPQPQKQRSVRLTVYASSDGPVDTAATETTLSLAGPHSAWERVAIPSTTLPTPVSDELHVDWFDLRSMGEDFLPTRAACVHFFRTLLDTKHGSSPWWYLSKPASWEEQEKDGSWALPQQPDAVLLVISREMLEGPIVEFRLTDACPSWFLHVVANIQCSSIPWSSKTEASDDAMVLVYRRLSPRDQITIQHPLSKTAPTTGCLWQTYLLRPKEGEDPKKKPEMRFRTVSPPYINVLHEYPGLVDALFTPEAIDTFEREAREIAHWTAWPEQQHYQAKSDSSEAPWTVFPLCYCFPAFELEKRHWVKSTCAFVPETARLLRETLGDSIRTALFSRLDPDSVLEPHTGWDDLANHVYRLHIPLVVPEGDLCGTWVDGCVETHKRGRPLCFDDSKTHRAFNYSQHARIVLIVDLYRPDHLPKGTAVGGHSEELDKFIETNGLT